MTHRIRTKNFVVQFKNIFLLISAWALCLILPHFQTQFDPIMAICQMLISMILFYAIYTTLKSTEDLEKFLKTKALVLIPLFYLVSIILNLFGKDYLYLFINRFGAGSMLLDGKIYMYGDLAHLTAASSCNISVQIGANICDPFNRLFNQNPHIVDFLKIIHFTNTFLFGLVSTILFFILIIIIAYKKQISILLLFIILLSPPTVLAIDRGNEIITILLILPGLYLFAKHKNIQIVGAFLLALSAFFKLWTSVLILSLLILLWKKINIFSKIIMILPLFYWFYFHENALRMVEYTQKGSRIGLSLGLKHYLDSTIKPEYLLLIFILIVILSVYFLLRSKLFDQNLYRESTDLIILNALFLTYVSIWIFGISFIYRLIIFIPIIIFLNKTIREETPRIMLQSGMILSMLTSKLLITTVFTSILAIVFSAIVAYQLVLFLKDTFPNYLKK